ncbi:MAG: hypothetical protein MUC48_21565 [Leptolyngbya sp. Prado105]|jgi:hypothetical protein|nr:hypothetical protein [Leptolyngbya sp. Prado105]
MNLSLICEFKDQSPSFALGFEAGTVFEAMNLRVPSFDGTYHYASVDQLIAIAQSMNYRVVPLSKTEGWCELRFERLLTEEESDRD